MARNGWNGVFWMETAGNSWMDGIAGNGWHFTGNGLKWVGLMTVLGIGGLANIGFRGLMAFQLGQAQAGLL